MVEARHLQVVIELIDKISKPLASIQKSLRAIPADLQTTISLDDQASSALEDIGSSIEDVGAGLQELQDEAESTSAALADVSIEGGATASAIGAVSAAGSRLTGTLSSWGDVMSAQISRLGSLGEALRNFKTEILAANVAMTGFAAVCLDSAIDEEKYRAELDRLLGTDAAKPIHEWIDAAAQLSYTNKGARAELAATLTYFGLTTDQTMELGDNLERLVATFPSVGRSAIDVAEMLRRAVASGDPAAWERLNRVLGTHCITEEEIEKEYARLVAQEKNLNAVRLDELRQTAAINVLNRAMSERLDEVKADVTTTSGRIRELRNRLADLSGDIGAILIPGLAVLIGALAAVIKLIQAIPGGETIVGIALALGIASTASILLALKIYDLYSKLKAIPAVVNLVAGAMSSLRAAAIAAAGGFQALATQAVTAFRTIAASAAAAIRSIYVSLGPVGIALIALGLILAAVITHWDELQSIAEKFGLAGILESALSAGREFLGWLREVSDRFGALRVLVLAVLGPVGLLAGLLGKLPGLAQVLGAGINIGMKLPEEIRGILSGIASHLSAVRDGIGVVGTILAGLFTFLMNLRDMFLTRAFQDLRERAMSLGERVMGALSGIWGKLTEFANTVGAKIDSLKLEFSKLGGWLEKINEGVWGAWNKPVSVKEAEEEQKKLEALGFTTPAASQATASMQIPPVGQTSIIVPSAPSAVPLSPKTKEILQQAGVDLSQTPLSQVGSTVRKTGLVLAHAGEEIVPADLVYRAGQVRDLLKDASEIQTAGPGPVGALGEETRSSVYVHMPIDIHVVTKKEIDPSRLRIEIEDLIRRAFRQYQT